jgi:hypothetical protein
MDVEKTVEFILSQQAGFAARQTEFDERLAKLTAFQDNQQKSIYDLIQVVRTLATQSTETDQKISHLTENMNALIKVVDGLVRGDSGKSTH